MTGDSTAMTIAVVLDTESKPGRRKLLDQIMGVSNSLGLNSSHVTREKLDSDPGQVSVQTADVALIDLSDVSQWSALFYQVGARESLTRRQNVFLCEEYQLSHLKRVLERPKVPLPTYELVVCSRERDAQKSEESTEFTAELGKKLEAALKRSKRESAELQRRFSYYSEKSEECIEDETSKTFYRLFIALRKSQDFEGIITLAEQLKSLPGNENLTKIPKIGYPYAFALNTRNHGNDRQRALAELAGLLDLTHDVRERSNIMCLCGRIYKDNFVESKYTDEVSLRSAINWYRRGFETDPNPFAGINLVTLLIASADPEDEKESYCIGALVSYWLGKLGSFSTSDVYWDLATALELGVAFGNYSMAITAAEKIYDVKPSPWCLTSTFRNIEILLHARPISGEGAGQIFLTSWIQLLKKTLPDSKV